MAGGGIDTAMSFSGNLALVGAGDLTGNNIGCLGYFFISHGRGDVGFAYGLFGAESYPRRP